MEIGQSITTSINGTPITAQITNISAAFVSAIVTGLPAGEEQPPIAWKIDDYTAAVANGQITELPAVETPEV
tara:strand:+ start:16917 stop:17132 length:216 start_codon:yes stop_codon:yes gene_type:complete